MEMRDFSVNVRRSKRRTIGIEVTPRGEVIVRAPYALSTAEIRRFVEKNEGWIEQHVDLARQRLDRIGPVEPLTKEELSALAQQALLEFPPRVASFARQMGVDYGRITIRNQKTRWGSCSSKGNLNFNCLLMLAPRGVQDYVIVHELAHRREMNHSGRFWSEVEHVLPDYRQQRQWLKEHGSELMMRNL